MAIVIADDFPAIAKRMKELAAGEPMEAGKIPDETAINPKTGKRYRWTGQEWLEETYSVPTFSFLEPGHVSVDPEPLASV